VEKKRNTEGLRQNDSESGEEDYGVAKTEKKKIKEMRFTYWGMPPKSQNRGRGPVNKEQPDIVVRSDHKEAEKRKGTIKTPYLK